MKRLMLTSFFRAFNEPVSPPPPPPPASPPVSPPPPAGDERKFTQKDVDKMMEDHRKGLQARNQELITELENQKKASNLTLEEKENLQARIDALSKEHLSKEQQASAEFEKLKKKYDSDTSTFMKERDEWKGRYDNTLVEHALTAAAAKHKAHSPEQIIRMFKGDVKVVPVLDDAGKPTGQFKTVMPVNTTDPKTQQPVTLELSVDEAIAKIRENEEFANMFIDVSKGGFDSNGNPKRGGGSATDGPPTDPAAYRKWRKDAGLKA